MNIFIAFSSLLLELCGQEFGSTKIFVTSVIYKYKSKIIVIGQENIPRTLLIGRYVIDVTLL